MKRYVGLAFCLLYLFGGIASALGDCFGPDRHQDSAARHVTSIKDSAQSDARQQEDDKALIHCPAQDFHMALARVTSSPAIKRLLNDERFSRNFDTVARRIACDATARVSNFSLSLFQCSLSTHLFLSVLKI